MAWRGPSWSTQTGWESAQESNQVEVVGDTIQLRELEIPDSAIHHWPMGAGSGSTVSDDIGSVDGSISGASWTNGSWRGNYALSFNAVDDSVSLSSSFLPDNNFTFFATLQPDSLSNWQQIIVDGEAGSGGHQLIISGAQNNVQFQINDGSDLVGMGASDGELFRIAAVVENGNVSIYKNGSSAGGEPTGLASTQSSQWFGRGDSGDSHYGGIIDNPIVCNSVLTGQEIQDDYSAQPWS